MTGAVAVERAAESSRTTHAAQEAIDACRYFAHLIVTALQGAAKEQLLSPHHADEVERHSRAPLSQRIADIARGSFTSKSVDEIRASGYVVHTLEAAIWAFHHTGNFRDGALLAVNLGEDADTTGAVYGQLAGAYYGAEGIPQAWRALIWRADDIRALATRLHELASSSAVK
jgi:ADP-ribosyl-[dinitrogen reductase] hydrolase